MQQKDNLNANIGNNMYHKWPFKDQSEIKVKLKNHMCNFEKKKKKKPKTECKLHGQPKL